MTCTGYRLHGHCPVNIAQHLVCISPVLGVQCPSIPEKIKMMLIYVFINYHFSHFMLAFVACTECASTEWVSIEAHARRSIWHTPWKV